jgi:hypothetical protein
MKRSKQYPRPRCPRCRELPYSTDPQLWSDGHNLRQLYPEHVRGAVRVQCNFCHYSWWSRNVTVLAGVLTPVPADSPTLADANGSESTTASG